MLTLLPPGQTLGNSHGTYQRGEDGAELLGNDLAIGFKGQFLHTAQTINGLSSTKPATIDGFCRCDSAEVIG
ncbi:hypothetical protein GCM10008094_10270 [Aidingimonas halophila]|nr:hypothetical protein GCM10008094_10270 [Aidingimonas halophila]